MSSTLLNALCTSQVSIGDSMAATAESAENCSTVLLNTADAWSGTQITVPVNYPGTTTPVNVFDSTMPDGVTPNPYYIQNNQNSPETGVDYTTAEIQTAVNQLAIWMAATNPTPSTSQMQAFQAESSAWTNAGSTMNSLANMQESPLKTLQQSEASNIQQINSWMSNTAALGQGLADLNGTAANLVTLLG